VTSTALITLTYNIGRKSVVAKATVAVAYNIRKTTMAMAIVAIPVALPMAMDVEHGPLVCHVCRPHIKTIQKMKIRFSPRGYSTQIT